jgi:O-methyltransferase
MRQPYQLRGRSRIIWRGLLELPAVCPVAAQYLAQYGLQDRADTWAANMFTDAWPSGYDAVLFSNIFHDWDRTSCLHLARRSFEVLPPGGRIYLHEMLLQDTNDGPLTPASFSLAMAFHTRGKQFSAGERGELLHEAGFGALAITPTYAYYSLVSASKPH